MERRIRNAECGLNYAQWIVDHNFRIVGWTFDREFWLLHVHVTLDCEMGTVYCGYL